MYRWLAISAALVLTSQRVAAAPFDEASYAALLLRFTAAVEDTVGTRVDYAGLRRSPEWRALVANLSQVDPTALRGDDRTAFWINAYNILAIDLVVQGAPEDSIKDLGSFFSPVWNRPAGTIRGRAYTLGQIEHEILRPMGDPRIHVAIVCASTSCPSLLREPWRGARLDEQYRRAWRAFLADPAKGARFDRGANRLYLSKIFDWFEEDFEASGGVVAFATRYLPEAEAKAVRAAGPKLRIRHLDYDWRLNGS